LRLIEAFASRAALFARPSTASGYIKLASPSEALMSTPKQIESYRPNLKKSSGPGKAEQFRTFGEILPGLCFEAVIDPQKPQSLQLHAGKGTRFWTSSQIEHRGQIYVPATIDDGLAQAVRFPAASAEFGSPTSLTGAMSDLICNFGRTTRENAELLAAFALSTWFTDCLRVAPVLHLTGSNTRAHVMMRLLGCLCRRPLLLGRLDLSALSTLPKGLEATLIIHDERLSKNVARTLDASRNRDLSIPFGRNWIHAYGAKVLFSDSMSVKASELRIHLAPTAGALPELKEDVEGTIAADFQSQLLRYRLDHFNTVRDSNFDCSDFNPDVQDNARALLTPLGDCNELRESVLTSLRFQNKEVAGARFTDLDCLVVEAALAFCHDPSKEVVFVQEMADAVNAILSGRHEDQTATSKAVGQALRGFGLVGERMTRGYCIDLPNSNREKIHRLAREHDVPSIMDGVERCDHCQPTDDSVSEMRPGV
jgi:hypothetical protein